ncbi:hypothetical protein ACFX15_038151 [Malus domestica]
MKEQIRARTKVEKDGELGERETLKESERERARERSVTEMRGKHGMGLPIPEITLPTPKYLKSLLLTLSPSHSPMPGLAWLCLCRRQNEVTGQSHDKKTILPLHLIILTVGSEDEMGSLVIQHNKKFLKQSNPGKTVNILKSGPRQN